MSGHDTPASESSVHGAAGTEHPLRLADFIRANGSTIVTEWEAFASTLTPASESMTPLQLRNHIKQMLDFLVEDMQSRQTPGEERLKSLGSSDKGRDATASELHAALRLAGGFNIRQMVSEFRALRASITRLWGQTNSAGNLDAVDVTRFNESIDQMISETVSYYTDTVRKTQDLFVGILGHDLRNPIQSIIGCAELLPRIGPLTDRQVMLCRQALESSERVTEMLDDLADLTRARFGAGFKITRAPMDAAFVVQQIAAEMRVSHPDRPIDVNVSGTCAVEWDKPRFGQFVSNLLGNAVAYGFPKAPISVVIDGTSDATVTLSVHNTGLPIPPAKMSTLFEPLKRVRSAGGPSSGASNLGLGLFIAHDIVVAHGGTLQVTSTEEAGTTFRAVLPRRAEGNLAGASSGA